LHAPLKGSRNRIRLDSAVHDELDDWRLLLDSLAARPTHIQEIIPDFPTWTGAHDASGRGMGGVFAGPDGTPYLWRHPWSATEAARLVSSTNRTGDLSINDFELAGNVAQLWLALPKMLPLSAILSGSDNSTSIHWIRKGSTSTSPSAGSFLLCDPGSCANTPSPRPSRSSPAATTTSPMLPLALGTYPTHSSAVFFSLLSLRPHPGQCST
jgi:hypothetical protein